MISNYTRMFYIVSDIAKIHNNYIPLPSHEDTQKKMVFTNE